MANSITIHETNIGVGDTVKVHYSFKDNDKKKSQIFEGIVLSIRGRESNKMFTVRKMTRSKIGVERIFPAISPFLEHIEVVRKGHTKRAKIAYIRNSSEREIRDRLYTK